MGETIKGLTGAGLIMKARLEAYGIPFKITRIVAGASTSEDPLSLSEVSSPKQEFTITKREQRDASAILHTRLTNVGLDEGYSMWQIGIYAESDETPEICYRIIQFASPRPVPPFKDGGFSYSPVFYITAANSENITIELNPSWADEAVAQAQGVAEEALRIAEEALAKSGQSGCSTIISDDEPTELCNIWLQPVGEALIGGGGLQAINISGAHIGAEPPDDTRKFWAKTLD